MDTYVGLPEVMTVGRPAEGGSRTSQLASAQQHCIYTVGVYMSHCCFYGTRLSIVCSVALLLPQFVHRRLLLIPTRMISAFKSQF